MGAEQEARMVADLLTGRVLPATDGAPPMNFATRSLEIVRVQKVCDLAHEQDWRPVKFEHSCLTLPWPAAAFVWTVGGDAPERPPISYAMVTFQDPADGTEKWTSTKGDWSVVKNLLFATVFIHHGGQTHGPLCSWRIALDGNGEAFSTQFQQHADIGGLNAMHPVWTIFMASLEFLNFRNIEAEEDDTGDRAQRRRVKRELGDNGVVMKTLYVYPKGARRSNKREVFNPGVRHHGVRGHEACYGPRYGKGLLFGKYEGRFWIPPYVKGDKALGEVEKVYDLRPQDEERDAG